jgi:hypothetical protein
MQSAGDGIGRQTIDVTQPQQVSGRPRQFFHAAVQRFGAVGPGLACRIIPVRFEEVQYGVGEGTNLSAAGDIDGPVTSSPQRPSEHVLGFLKMIGVFEGGQDDGLENVVGRVGIAHDGGGNGSHPQSFAEQNLNDSVGFQFHPNPLQNYTNSKGHF